METAMRRLMTGLLLVVCVAPGPVAAQKKFTFAVFGDNRPNASDAPQPLAFRRMCIEMGKLKPAPELVVGLGDFVYGASSERRLREQYADFFQAMAP